MGKTTAVLAIAANTAFDKQTRVAFFSLEMSIADLKGRLAAKGTGIPYSKIRQGKLTPIELTKVLEYYDIVDASTLILIERIVVHERIIKKIKDLVLKDGIQLVIIDYVQLIKLSRRTSSKTADIGDITNDLKALCNELNIPIVIVAQLSRDVDNRPGHRPLLTDLKWAGAIEEDADTVAFLLREAYYNTLPGMELPMEISG
ncbi:MAG: DnaB-like helicase C-terminal domain-containing protein, partial [Proteobacteria bacterium]|nr:DnaB-like helicase C-terminal domain-containing protein [Pseudomonadota bacterium]